MNQSDARNMLKRSHDATSLEPSADLRPSKHGRFDENAQERLDIASSNTRSAHTSVQCGPSQYQLDFSVIEQEEQEPAIARPHPHASCPLPPHAPVSTESTASPYPRHNHALFQNSHGFTISGNPNFHNIGSVNQTNVYGGRTDALENLKPFVSFDAQFDSSAQDPERQCHPGTREAVLNRLRGWIDNYSAKERILWLYGPAGAGKSAIAQTIAHSEKIAATFFFFKSDPNRNDGKRLFTTLAYQLAFSIPGLKRYIVDSLSERPDLPRAGIQTQFNQLLIRPCQALRMDATQKLAQAFFPVIIIDGVDECIDENLQRQFLNVIGDAVKDDRIPLRFLIVSRPELHIEHIINRLKTPILRIDLAQLDDASRDIEIYLIDEFSRIASEQGLDPSWPGQDIINNIVYKSSGNFIYPSVVIRFVGDPYCYAKTQLEIVLNMKPPKTLSPFAILDQLFLEILQRVPDQDFLKKYLALLISRISLSNSFGDLYKDEPVLMLVSEEELHANLRRMRSLLKFRPSIDIHHRSFLDFLYDSSRSGDYHVGEHGGIMRHLELFVDSLIQYINNVIERPEFHNSVHFAPNFRATIKDFRPQIKATSKRWYEVIQPLLNLQDKLLQLPNFTYIWELLPCEECTSVPLLRELLHLGLHSGILEGVSGTFTPSVMDLRKYSDAAASTTTQVIKMKGNDLDGLLLSLFAHLPETTENWTPNKRVIRLMSSILCFGSVETAKRICFISDAQKLVDFLYYLIDEKDTLSKIHVDGMRQATLLGLEIFARVPVLPLHPSSRHASELFHPLCPGKPVSIQIISQTILASRYLSNCIIPLFAVRKGLRCYEFVTNVRRGASVSQYLHQILVRKMQVILRLAKVIQYLHSFGVVIDRRVGLNDVVVDPGCHPKIRCLVSTSQLTLAKQYKERLSLENNTLFFGYLVWELFYSIETKSQSPSEERIKVPEYVRDLIQRCCAPDPKRRPTMDEVVVEMESWEIEQYSDPV